VLHQGGGDGVAKQSPKEGENCRSEKRRLASLREKETSNSTEERHFASELTKPKEGEPSCGKKNGRICKSGKGGAKAGGESSPPQQHTGKERLYLKTFKRQGTLTEDGATANERQRRNGCAQILCSSFAKGGGSSCRPRPKTRKSPTTSTRGKRNYSFRQDKEREEGCAASAAQRWGRESVHKKIIRVLLNRVMMTKRY